MTIPSTGVSEASPAGSDIIALGDNKIREYKVQNREIMEVDHTYPSSGQSATAGTHKKVTLIEQADLGTGAEGIPILGAQTVSGVAELVFTTEANADLQITSGQYILGSSIRFANNTSLYAKDAAGTGTVDLIKSNASDQTVLPTATVLNAGAILLESTAPTTIANQGAVYTKNDGDQTELYFREESNGDEVQVTNAGVLANTVALTVSSILDYGTSASASTTKTQSGLKVCYGTVSVGNSASVAITNLPFASAGAYSVVCSIGTNASGADQSVHAVRNSGSQFTIYNRNGDDGALDINWIAIGD